MQQPPAQPERTPLPWSRFCFVCGADNPIGLRARSYKVGGAIELPFVVRPEFAGWSEVAHGGLIATVLDEVMTWAAILGSEKPCFAAELTVRLQKPLPPRTDCVAVGSVTAMRRSIADTAAFLRDTGGQIYARATGRYMPVPPDRMAHLRQDFVRTPDCLDVARFFGQ
jgi:acyl-coenzyme A thioesterase PaaI-like protein